jgi:hypothetical protein
VLLLVLGVGLIGKGIPDFERITRCR